MLLESLFYHVVLFITLASVVKQGCYAIKLITLNGYIIRGRPFTTLKIDWMGCVIRCQNDYTCMSYNYYNNKDEGICELNSHGLNYYCRGSTSQLINFPGAVFQQLRHSENNGKDRAAPASCLHLLSSHNTSGIYSITPSKANSFPVYCDQSTAGGGWVVIQRRLNGSVDFNRSLSQYQRGFGDLAGEFWLGLDSIHLLTSAGTTVLRVDMADFNGTTAYAEYDSFQVGSSSEDYRLHIGTYNKGDAGDSLSFHQNMTFSTVDHDTDHSMGQNCAQMFVGAWWYNDCHESNLNGPYKHGKHSSFADGINWKTFRGYYYSLKYVEMKIRPSSY